MFCNSQCWICSRKDVFFEDRKKIVPQKSIQPSKSSSCFIWSSLFNTELWGALFAIDPLLGWFGASGVIAISLSFSSSAIAQSCFAASRFGISSACWNPPEIGSLKFFIKINLQLNVLIMQKIIKDLHENPSKDWVASQAAQFPNPQMFEGPLVRNPLKC